MQMTDKQKKFCDEYLIDLNATQAAIRAGYSKKTANRIASENLSKLDIQEYISAKKKELQKKNEIKLDDVVEALKTIGFADINPAIIKASDKIKALEVIAKMLGLNETTDNGRLEELIGSFIHLKDE